MTRLLAIVLALTFMCPRPALADEEPGIFRITSELQPERPLKPGEFTWAGNDPDEKGSLAALTMVVDLKAQLLHVYRGGDEIALSTVSTGRKGFETPTGVFPILEKDLDHYSDTYDLAPMPFMQRMTWDGIALHGGKVPGYRASHGCIRLPEAFARILFSMTRKGDKVIVSPDWEGTATTYAVAYDPDPAQLRLDAAGR